MVRSLEGTVQRLPLLDRQRRAHLSRRQPAYEAAAVLALGDPNGQEAPSGCHLFSRGFYEAEDHVLAGESGVFAVIYVLRVAQYEIRADGVLRVDYQTAGQRLLSSKFVAEYA